jgi:hypothetical protein
MPSAPFTINLPPVSFMGEPNDNLMETLKVYSATKYAKTRAEVEEEIQERWNSANKAKEEAEAETISWCEKRINYLENRWAPEAHRPGVNTNK